MNSLELLQQIFPVLHGAVPVVLLTVMIAAAVYDIRYRRIPNWVTAGGVVLGIAINAVIGESAGRGLLFALAGFGVAFGLYMALYILRAMGAGDVKLMAAVGALVGWKAWFGVFFVTAIVGGIMALLLVLMRGRLKHTLWNVGFIVSEMGHGRPAYVGKEELDVRSPKAIGLPHGAVIAVSVIFFLAIGLRLPR
jgi:prepilin peptidase CpaA